MLESIIENLFEFIVPVFFVFLLIILSIKGKQKKPDVFRHAPANVPVKPLKPMKPAKTVSSDGHVIDPKNDPTCAKYGHVHEETKHRYIVHDEPVEGYVNLNGKLITLQEAAKY